MVDDRQEILTHFLETEAKSIDLSSPAFEKGFWERPKLAAIQQGDVSVEAIYLAVGFALTQWETLENILVEQYLIFCGSDNPITYNAIRRSFGTIESSDGRKKAIDEAAHVYFGDDLYPKGLAKPYKDLLTAHGKAAQRRNEIAHGVAHAITLNGDHKGCFLFPAAYNSARNFSFMTHIKLDEGPFLRENYRYTSREIFEIAHKFGALTDIALRCLAASGKIGAHHKILLANLNKQ
ncbi:TPA: hypothetical protein MIG85_15610 [Klebsiella pneumoniae]|nr:hypothetical protein [Klebsiella pneumoniae]